MKCNLDGISLTTKDIRIIQTLNWYYTEFSMLKISIMLILIGISLGLQIGIMYDLIRYGVTRVKFI